MIRGVWLQDGCKLSGTQFRMGMKAANPVFEQRALPLEPGSWLPMERAAGGQACPDSQTDSGCRDAAAAPSVPPGRAPCYT